MPSHVAGVYALRNGSGYARAAGAAWASWAFATDTSSDIYRVNLQTARGRRSQYIPGRPG
jgi:hypothetical protein